MARIYRVLAFKMSESFLCARFFINGGAMKKIILLVSAITLGILATNYLISRRNNVVEKAEEVWMTDEVETSQAADTPL
jgi:hypothetical protein